MGLGVEMPVLRRYQVVGFRIRWSCRWYLPLPVRVATFRGRDVRVARQQLFDGVSKPVP